MKNLKKVLALALAFAMSLTLFAGAAFTDDASIGVDYKDDVNMLVQLGIIGGYGDGSFKPQGTITRAETTKLIYVLNYGYDDAGKLFSGAACEFTDVAANADWAKGYINYCYNQGIVGGVGNKKFNPNGKVTVAELAKMLLVSLGANAEKEGYGGPNWASNVTADAMELGVFDGWTGDPTQPASRELACKLMRNTIFAPSYQYNAITGIGSQVNALDGKTANETLGEKKMGLKHVKGLVVANPRYALPNDAEGIKVAAEVGDKALNPVKDKSRIYYEVTGAVGDDADNNGQMAILTVEADLSDDMLGNMVDVYFKADESTTGTYKNVELIGDVLVSADTVAYDVMAADIEMMPNGATQKTKEIKPYISFTTEDGEEKKVYGRVDYLDGDENKEIVNNNVRVEENVDYTGDAFATRLYIATNKVGSEDGELISPKVDAEGALIKSDGKDANVKKAADALMAIGTEYKYNKLNSRSELDRYRFISVDGGDTYSYILCLSDIVYTRVSTINDSTISLGSSIGVRELGTEAVTVGDVKKGMPVIAYNKDGKVYVEPTETVVGKASNLQNGGATINGKKYIAAYGIFNEESETELDAFLTNNYSLNNESATYTTYRNYVLEVSSEAAVAGATDYAVILYSDYDEATGVVKVKLAFADNTVATYEVSNIGGNEDKNEELKGYFAYNLQCGTLVRTSVSNGRVSLAANDIEMWKIKIGSNGTRNGAVVNSDGSLGTSTPEQNLENARAYVNDGKFYYGANKDKKAYYDNGNSIIFMLYGGALTKGEYGSYPNDYADEELRGQDKGTYGSLKAKAYKLSSIGDAAGTPKPVYAKIGAEGYDKPFAPYYIGDIVESSNSNGMKTVIAGVMSVGERASAGKADPDSLAYILNASYNYSTDTDKWYLDVDMITKDGLVSTRSIDEANNGSDVWVPKDESTDIGHPAIEPGSLVMYEMCAAEDGSDAEWIMTLETSEDKGLKSNMVKAGAKLTSGAKIEDGYYAVQIGVVDEEQIAFFANSHKQLVAADKESWADDIITMDINPYRFGVTAIDDINFVEGGDIETIGYSDVFAEGSYNAIIVVEKNEIVRVFSLYDNLKPVKN